MKIKYLTSAAQIHNELYLSYFLKAVDNNVESNSQVAYVPALNSTSKDKLKTDTKITLSDLLFDCLSWLSKRCLSLSLYYIHKVAFHHL